MDWSEPCPDYRPTEFTASFVLSAPWADPCLEAEDFRPVWNSVDGKVNRVSHEGEYQISQAGRPLNIRGRTGLTGRGVLGKWGPNHAADPIVTRWRRNQAGEIIKNEETGKNVLEFVSIQRKDSGEEEGYMTGPLEMARLNHNEKEELIKLRKEKVILQGKYKETLQELHELRKQVRFCRDNHQEDRKPKMEPNEQYFDEYFENEEKDFKMLYK